MLRALFLFLIVAFLISCQDEEDPKLYSIFEIESPELGETKTIWLYLPSDYFSSTKNYPVIYFSDGQWLFETNPSYSQEMHVDEMMRDFEMDMAGSHARVAHRRERVGRRPDRAKAVTAVGIGIGDADTLEIRVQRRGILVVGMRVTAPVVGLPDIDPGIRQRFALEVGDAAAHEYRVTGRSLCVAFQQRQVDVGLGVRRGWVERAFGLRRRPGQRMRDSRPEQRGTARDRAQLFCDRASRIGRVRFPRCHRSTPHCSFRR